MTAAAAMHPAYDTRERLHPRVQAGFMVKLLIPNRAPLLARAQDLSMAGLCLQGNPLPGVTRFVVSVPLPQDREVTASCVVRRCDEEGTAIEFEQLDWDDLLALARYLHPRLP